MEDVALFLHLLGVLLFVSGIVVAGVSFEAARRKESAGEVALLLGLGRYGVGFVGAGSLLLFVCGLWLVGLEDDVGFGTGWVGAAIALFLLVVVLGSLGGRRPKQARLLATELAERGEPVGTGLRALLDDPLSRAANYAAAVLILAILALMVFKPYWSRGPPRRRRSAPGASPAATELEDPIEVGAVCLEPWEHLAESRLTTVWRRHRSLR